MFSLEDSENFLEKHFNLFLLQNFPRSIRLALAKKSQNDADHRALLYNYYNQLSNQHFLNPKRNFDEIDRFSDFDKRDSNNNNRLSSYTGKRIILPAANFDEIDRNGFNEFRKRNFDEIDRHGFGNDF